MNKFTSLVLGIFLTCFSVVGQNTRLYKTIRQGLTDSQIFQTEDRVAIRLSDTTGSGLPSPLFSYIQEQNPKTSPKRLFFLSTGPKGSSGYGLYCSKIQLRRNKLLIFIKEIKPKPGNFYNDVITYPGLWIETPRSWRINSFEVFWR